MAWIESHQELGRHPKTIRLAQELKCDPPHAVGYLHFLWWWCLDYATDGIVAHAAQPIAAHACFWRGRVDRFWQALLAAGFVDACDGSQDVRIHDWGDYAGKLSDQRAWRRVSNRKAQSARRQRLLEALVSAESSADDADRQQPTVHNSTGQYRTVAAVAAPVARAREDDGGGSGFQSLERLLKARQQQRQAVDVPPEVRERLAQTPIAESAHAER